MAGERIVVVEDEQPIRRGVCDALRASGYHPLEADDGAIGLQRALEDSVHLVLLDLLLPKLDGLEVLTRLRSRRPQLPVIMLTARGSEEDRVRGLKMGADDYVVKPFSARELLARVEAVMRRVPPPKVKATHQAKLGEGIIDFDRREVLWPGQAPRLLSEMEAGLLELLLRNRDRAVSREELLETLWGVDANGLETRTVDMHIARLRAKLRSPSENGPEAIITVRAQGYMVGKEWIWQGALQNERASDAVD
ncbi:Alkaline phosphatase synthesis transcriptional regulatory protein SphR [Planctomycetales bacterium 10988]|nr:Alkaline phosphatase synthesis transcriptional regulatory protein SphR [Planctomycetales bacterium 10988]